MAGQNASHVVVAGTGAVYVAPELTPMPSDLVTPLPAAWKDIGYISEDGVTFTFSREQEDVMAWQVSTPVRILVTNEPITVEYELEQIDRDTVMLAFRGGAFAGSTAPFTYTPPAAGASDVRAMVVDAKDGNYTFRFCFSRLQISDDVAMQLLRSDIMRLPLKFNVLAATPKWSVISDHPSFSVAGLLMADEQAAKEAETKSKAA
jgi:hypothetical protein